MIKCLEIMLDVCSREVWRNRLVKVEEIWRNRLTKDKSGYDPRRKKKRGPCESPEFGKHIQAELIRCFELAMYQSLESRTKQKGKEVSQKNHTIITVCEHFSHLWVTLTLSICIFKVIKKNMKRSWLYFYTSALFFFFSVYNINMKLNANSFIQDLNSGCQFHFQ